MFQTASRDASVSAGQPRNGDANCSIHLRFAPIKWRLTIEQHGIAEFMRTVAACSESCGGAGEEAVVGKGAQQLEMAFAGLVDASEDRIDDAERSAPCDTPCRNAISGTHAAIGIGGCFKCSHDAGADRDDAAASELRPRYLRHGTFGDAVRLIEG